MTTTAKGFTNTRALLNFEVEDEKDIPMPKGRKLGTIYDQLIKKITTMEDKSVFFAKINPPAAHIGKFRHWLKGYNGKIKPNLHYYAAVGSNEKNEGGIRVWCYAKTKEE